LKEVRFLFPFLHCRRQKKKDRRLTIFFANKIHPTPSTKKITLSSPLLTSPAKKKKIHPLPKIQQTETAKLIKAVLSTALTIRCAHLDYFHLKLFVSTSLIKPTHHGQDQRKNPTKPAKKTGLNYTPRGPNFLSISWEIHEKVRNLRKIEKFREN
jgi:hypothetical protein